MTDREDLHELDDGRDVGDWQSRFDCSAWVQIGLELSYLIVLLIICVGILIDGASGVFTEDGLTLVKSRFVDSELSLATARWIALAVTGMIGGIVFDLKWLYHSVGHGVWNRDRVLWRLIVPFNSAMVSLFTGFLFASGVIPFLRNEEFSNIYTLLGFGFLFGYFSDNILAAMQNVAQKLFGTLGGD